MRAQQPAEHIDAAALILRGANAPQVAVLLYEPDREVADATTLSVQVPRAAGEIGTGVDATVPVCAFAVRIFGWGLFLYMPRDEYHNANILLLHRYNHVNYTWDNRVTFSHLFLQGWDAEQEVEAYPPAIGPFALYKKAEFFDTIDYAVRGYANVSTAIGPYSYPTDDNRMPPLLLCLYRYKQGEIFGYNESYVFNPEIVRECTNVTLNATTTAAVADDGDDRGAGIRAYLDERDIQINFVALVKATLSFGLKTVNFKVSGGY